jgi:hypothetical protein
MVTTSPRRCAGTTSHAPSGSRPHGDRYRDKREHDRSIYFSKRAFEPAGAAQHRPGHTDELGHGRKADDQRNRGARKRTNKRKRREESDIRNDIAYLVQDAAEAALLPEFDGERSIDGRECGTRHEPGRKHRERRGIVRKAAKERANQDGADEGRRRYLIGGDARFVQTAGDGPQRPSKQRLQQG